MSGRHRRSRFLPRMLPGLAGCVLAALTACSVKKISDRSLAYVNPEEAEALMHERKDFLGLGGRGAGVWVDPRSRGDYLAGHIPNAVHLPYQSVETEHERLADYDVIVVYGEDYGSTLAPSMSKTLLELGFKDVRTLRGGLRAWEASGNPIEGSETEE